MKEAIKEWIKIILFFGAILTFLVLLVHLGGEDPHRVTIEGKEYIRMKEWNGSYFQIILLPADSLK